MKIVSIISSNRKSGNTERLIGLLEEELGLMSKLQHELLEIERISLGHAELKMCLGCRVCFDKGEEMCPLKDVILTIREKLNEADGVILASPVYVEDVNGIMKNWIDRMAFNSHRPAFAGKTAVVVSTSGMGSTNHTLKTMKVALMLWGLRVVGQYKFVTGDLMEIDDVRARYRHKIRKAAKALFISIKNQKALKPAFHSLIVFKVQKRYWQKNVNGRQDTVDYKYWNNKGWLEPRCDYYTAIETNWLKVKLARFFGKIIAMFFV